MGQSRKITAAALFLCLNLILGVAVAAMKIPLLMMDTLGTVFAGALMGPWWGALVGGCTNLVMGVLKSPMEIPFALVNVGIGLAVGAVARRWGFKPLTALFTGLVIAVLAPLIGTPIAVWLFGGLSGSGTDFLVLWARKAGATVFSSAFYPRVASNLLDKTLCCLIVSFLLERLNRLGIGRR